LSSRLPVQLLSEVATAVRGIEDMRFKAQRTRDGKFVGRVYEFPELRTRPYTKAIDAVDDIIGQTAQRIADIHESQWIARQASR
jgi:hypothetical protein